MRKTFLLILAAVLLAAPALAEPWEDAMRAANNKAREARSMANAGRPEDADRAYAAAVGMLPMGVPEEHRGRLRSVRAKLQMQWGESQLTRGRYVDTRPYGAEAAEAAGRIGNKTTLARIHQELAVNAGGLCRFSEAADHYRREAGFRRQAGESKKADTAEFNASMVAGRKDGQGVLCP